MTANNSPIKSSQNALIKRIRRLQNKKFRLREGAFFVEGIRVVRAALDATAPIEKMIVAPELITSDIAQAAVDTFKARGGQVQQITEPLFQTISGRDTPAGVAAIIRTTDNRLSSLNVEPSAIFALVDRIADPGNLGTLIRTVDSMGGAGVIIVGDSVDPWHPSAVKASMGALFTVPIVLRPTHEALAAWLQANQMTTVATTAHAPQTVWQAQLTFPALLMLGSERHGLSAELSALATASVSLPMRGTSSSLNLSVAAGIMLYELDQRRI